MTTTMRKSCMKQSIAPSTEILFHNNEIESENVDLNRSNSLLRWKEPGLKGGRRSVVTSISAPCHFSYDPQQHIIGTIPATAVLSPTATNFDDEMSSSSSTTATTTTSSNSDNSLFTVDMDHHHATLAFFKKLTTRYCKGSWNYLRRESIRITRRCYCNAVIIGNDERESRNDVDLLWDQEHENDAQDRYMLSLCATALPVSSSPSFVTSKNKNSTNKNSGRWNHRGKYVKPNSDKTTGPVAHTSTRTTAQTAQTSRTSNTIISAPMRGRSRAKNQEQSQKDTP